MNTIEKDIRNSGKRVIFTDFYDTLVHRKVHPNYTLRIWAKLLTRELGLDINPELLFQIRKDSLHYISKRKNKNSLELDYDFVVEEVFKRLFNNDLLRKTKYSVFYELYEKADILSETTVQFKNKQLIQALYNLKNEGYKIYLISDFYLSKEIIAEIIQHHQFADLFEDLFVSSSESSCKENGSLYSYVLKQLNIDPEQVVMIGDNKKSDYDNALAKNIASIHLKHASHKLRNKKGLFGNDLDEFANACKGVERKCTKSKFVFSEYILHFYFFTERLYLQARKQNINNLFFLAREGHFLKQLFDQYQEMNGFENENRIKTHYLKASRQSATQLALQPLKDEKFGSLMKKFGSMSFNDFLDWFPFSDQTKNQIKKEVTIPQDEVHSRFFESEALDLLKSNPTFERAYEESRLYQKEAFISYLDSFEADLNSEGLHLVDVGWGGTMQEALFNHFEQKIPVTGFYLGLKEIYNIQKGTKRYGLNFSIYPNKTFSDDILMANGQLYEQLLAAPHGSTLYYNKNAESPTVEFHDENEKFVYEEFVGPIQEFMLEKFQELFNVLRPIDYDQEMAQDYMTDMALRIGIFSTKKRIQFVRQISKGFYQNVGANKVGITYDPTQLKTSKTTLFKRFITSPEKVFRYIVKLKPFLYSKGLYWASKPIDLIYYYIKVNLWAKKKWLSKGLIP